MKPHLAHILVGHRWHYIPQEDILKDCGEFFSGNQQIQKNHLMYKIFIFAEIF